MKLVEQDKAVLEHMLQELLQLRHRINTINVVEHMLGNHVYGLMGDDLGPIPGETLCKEWDNHEGRQMRTAQADKYLAFHERKVEGWLKRLLKGSSKKTK